MNTNENTGINALFQAVFLECLYQKKFSRMLTRQETVSCLTGPRFEGSFLALLGFSPLYTVTARDKGKIIVKVNKNVYLCDSYACFALVIAGQERDKTFQTGRTDVYTWNEARKEWDFDSPIPPHDFEILKIVLFDEYDIRL